jgi:hypothetical protein
MKSLTLGGLNPLNPAHYLAAIGSLALVSRLSAGDGSSEAAIHWSAGSGPADQPRPFRAVIRMPEWNFRTARALFKLFAAPCRDWLERAELEDIAEGGSGLLEDQLERAKIEASRPDTKPKHRFRMIAVVTDRKPDDVQERAQRITLAVSALPPGRPSERNLRDSLRALTGKPVDKPVVVFGKKATVAKLCELPDLSVTSINPQGTGRRFSDLAQSALESSSISEGVRLVWLSNGRLAQNQNAEATSWMLGRKAGLLRPLRQTSQPTSLVLRFRRLRQILGGPAWPYETNGPMLGMDSDTSTDGSRSVRNTDGASPPQCLEALRLIGEALPLFIVGARGRVGPISRDGAEAALPALSASDREALAFVYPLWSAPLTLPEVSVLLNYPWHKLVRSPARLRHMGVWAVLAAPCQKKGSAGDPTERQFGRAVRVV